jgi:hypothetical protein
MRSCAISTGFSPAGKESKGGKSKSANLQFLLVWLWYGGFDNRRAAVIHAIVFICEPYKSSNVVCGRDEVNRRLKGDENEPTRILPAGGGGRLHNRRMKLVALKRLTQTGGSRPVGRTKAYIDLPVLSEIHFVLGNHRALHCIAALQSGEFLPKFLDRLRA